MRQMIVGLMEGPIKQINGYDELITRINEGLQRNIRRTHELDFILQKYQRAATVVETYEKEMKKLEGIIKKSEEKMEHKFEEFGHKVENEIPD